MRLRFLSLILFALLSGPLVWVSEARVHVQNLGGSIASVAQLRDARSTRDDYGPFGELIRASGSNARLNPFRFSTQFQDDESDLVYYGYRFYNASTGRWLNRDPLEEGGGVNVYGFVGNNGVSQFDVDGLWFKEFFRDTASRFYDNYVMGTQSAQGYGGTQITELSKELGGAIDPQDNVLRNSVVEGGAMLGDQVTDQVGGSILGKGVGMAAGSVCNIGKKLGKNIAALWNRAKGALGRNAAKTAEEATGFLGSKGFELKNLQAVRNTPEVIGGRNFSGHALDQMQNRGIMPSVVENTLKNATSFPDKTATTTGFYDAVNNVRVIVNSQNGTIVTVIRGAP